MNFVSFFFVYSTKGEIHELMCMTGKDLDDVERMQDNSSVSKEEDVGSFILPSFIIFLNTSII